MDITTGAVCPWGNHPQRDLPRHPARIAAINGPNDRSDGMPKTRVTDWTERDEISDAAREAAHGCCEDVDAYDNNGRDE